MIQRTLFLFVVASSLLIALATVRIFPLGAELAFPAMAHQILNAEVMFLLHVSSASVALALGALQILPKLRKTFPAVHRWLGRLYAVAVLLGAVSGFAIALKIDGVGSTVGFAALAVLWLLITTQAVSLARARKFAAHRRWMICSFALTFAAVTLRLQLLVFIAGFNMTYEQVYPILAWSCWVPNLAFALWFIQRPAVS